MNDKHHEAMLRILKSVATHFDDVLEEEGIDAAETQIAIQLRIPGTGEILAVERNAGLAPNDFIDSLKGLLGGRTFIHEITTVRKN